MPEVSVILSSYHHEKYIAEAIESVLGQTFQDFELLICDDGSTDGSAEVIRSFRDPRIRAFLHEENRGPLAILREAVAESRGRYIAIHHSDDAWEPEKLARQVRFLEGHPEYAACFTLVKFMDEEGGDYVPPEGSFYGTTFRQPNRTRAEWLRHFFFHGNCLCHPSLLIRREMYEECGLLELDGLWQLPDFCMWVKLSLRHPFYILQEPLTKFRLRRKEQTQQSGERLDVLVRSEFELYQVLQLYKGIEQRELMLEIFPEAGKYLDGQTGDVLFALAKVAQGVESSPYQLLALDILYHALRDANRAKAIRDKCRYTIRDFVAETGTRDVFRVASLLHFLHITVFVEHEDGFAVKVENAGALVTKGGTFFARFRIDDDREQKSLLVDLGGSYRKIALGRAAVNGQPMEAAPLNAEGEEDGYDVFSTAMPRYRIPYAGKGQIVLELSGALDPGSGMDLGTLQILHDEKLASRERDIQDRDRRLEKVGGQIASRDRKIAALGQELDAGAQELAARTRELAARTQELAARTRELAVIKEEVRAIKNSRGWKLLESLRKARGKFFRKNGG